MEELRKNLRTGEKILWEGTPKQFGLLEGKIKSRILGEWIVTVVFAAWLLYVEKDNLNFGMGLKALVLVVAAAIIMSPVMEYYSLKRQKYYLTDQRAIVLTGDRTFYYMDLNKIDDFEDIRDVASDGCIAIGAEILPEVRRQLRWRACHPKTDMQETNTNGEALGMVFYLPTEMERALELLKASALA